jgi:RNA polymerase sigma-70 factor (ECF subfamily)
MSLSSPEPTWEADLRDARAGSGEALGRLLQGTWPCLVRVAHRLLPAKLRSKLDAADVAQEAFLEAFKDFARFTGSDEKQWLDWLGTILLNNLQDAARGFRRQKRNVSQEVRLDDGSGEFLESGEKTPSSHFRLVEELSRLQSALAELPELLQQVVRLHSGFGLTHGEIGQQLDLSANAVQKHWSQALRALKDCDLVATAQPE